MPYTDTAADRRTFALGNIADLGSSLEHITLELVAGFVSDDKQKSLIPLVGSNFVRLLQTLGNYIEVCDLDDSVRDDLKAWRVRADAIRIRRNRVIHDVALTGGEDFQLGGYRISALGVPEASRDEGDLTELWDEILRIILDLGPLTTRLLESPDWHGMPGSLLGSRGLPVRVSL